MLILLFRLSSVILVCSLWLLLFFFGDKQISWNLNNYVTQMNLSRGNIARHCRSEHILAELFGFESL